MADALTRGLNPVDLKRQSAPLFVIILTNQIRELKDIQILLAELFRSTPVDGAKPTPFSQRAAQSRAEQSRGKLPVSENGDVEQVRGESAELLQEFLDSGQ